ncbi:MAG: histidine kinase dimerization/phospho-acceptor domain-containing protein, partial [Elusimicrobiota bacterium]|nr:histidine kinase dimerization/phospho-acceptor domain-containing protein [Elusimicrobiota bacterium]
MRKEKKKIDYFIYSAGALFIAGGIYMALISEDSAVAYGFWGLTVVGALLYVSSLLKKRERELDKTWRDIFKSSCTKINYSSSEFGLKRNVGYILFDLCKVRNISGAWILIKKDDGNYRLEAQRGIDRFDSNFSVKDLSEYICANVKDFTSPLIKNNLPPQVKSDNKDAVMHIPITRGNLVRGVLSITAKSSRDFKKPGINNFLIITKLIEQLYENSDQSNYFQNLARKGNEKVDITTDELTKTNLRLIDRVKELKSLYDLSLKVINAEDTVDAAQFIFRKIKVILRAEKSLFFEKKEGEFKLKYLSEPDLNPDLIGYSLPYSILPQKKGIILNDTKADEDLNYIARRFKLKHIMISPVKAGETIKGLIIAGGEELSKFSGRDVELLEMYSGRLGEYIDRKELLSRILNDNKRLKELNQVKDKFIALISHELRTPLTSIKGFSELLLNGDAGPVN